MRLNRHVYNSILLLSNLVLGATILVFAKGFFPYKAVLPGLAEWPEDGTVKVPAQFDKVIFMVVDALRSDFVYSPESGFHFTQSLIRSGAAVPFTGHASPPTITMPRVKSITTGSVPSFVDLVLNFAESDTTSTLATQDSWLAQLRAKPDGRLVMYGDDTWLRLFPGFFHRADGTTSFFVSDFTEVDNNVTRHVPDELSRDDWDGMIMHYLGLDHIGHKTGPRGPNMPAKQREMDGIVEQIYNAMDKFSHLNSTLLVLLGDHGMNEGGNHGANSAGEVSTALTFISPRFKNVSAGISSPVRATDDFKYYDLVDQSDVAPTLAALLSFPVPKNSLGTIIPSMLHLWPNKTDRYHLLYQNAKQIKQIADATYPEAFAAISDLPQCANRKSLPSAQQLACRWLAIEEVHQALVSNQFTFLRDGTPMLRAFLRDAQTQLRGAASKYDLSSMVLGASLLLVFTIGLGFFVLVPGSGTRHSTFVAFCFTTIMYAITMFASSYVEEEHQFWYWIASAWMLGLTLKEQRLEKKDSSLSSLVTGSIMCICFGTMRRWNQTGQKYAGEADLVTEFLTKSPFILWILIFLTYSVVPRRLRTRPAELGLGQLSVMPILVGTSALLFKVAFTAAEAPELLQGMVILQPVVNFAARYPLMSLARLVFLGLANLVGVAVYLEKPWLDQQHLDNFLEQLHDIISIFLMTQTRTVNIPLILIFHIQVGCLRRGRTMYPFEALVTMLCMQYASFFALGGTNAISSVDLSNAYNGVGGYNVLAVGILTFVSNWVGPVWWASATACVLRNKIIHQRRFPFFGILTTFAMVHTLAVMVACLALREHLFIWTVFSPKYLYMMAWTFAQHMVVNGIFSALISAGGPREA